MNSLCIEEQNDIEFKQKENRKRGILHDGSIIRNVPIALENENENEHLDVEGDGIKSENDSDSETANNVEMECDICTKIFKCNKSLEKQHKIHTAYKPYGCKTCKKMFSESGKLRIHERIHIYWRKTI